ncbi:MAG: calcium/sodium antiporter [Bacteroidales bacterium]|nr:calcium/sodium antiporter [Bacteroidales bacterium]
MLISIIYVVLSLVGLYFGASLLVKGAASAAERIGVTPLVVGLTVVAFGTSMPELIVSVQSAFRDHGDIAVGNAIGSNIANIGLILGISALIIPLRTSKQLLRIDAPVMILSVILFYVVFLDERINRWEGIILFLLLIAYTIFRIYRSMREKRSEILTEFMTGIPRITSHWGIDVLLIITGFGLLILSSHFLVRESVDLARMLGMTEAVIGLTIVAFGTSMPELATSVVAAIKKQPDIAIGNVVGSNIFNIFCILGIAATLHPFSAPNIEMIDIVVMAAFSVLLIPLIWRGLSLNRKEGGLFLAIYIAYIIIRLLNTEG